MIEESWIQMDRSGFFPKVEETKIQFALAYQDLFVRFPREIDTSVPWLISAKKQFYSLFLTVPCWVRASISSEGVLPWELAACWQFSDGQSKIHLCPRLRKEKETNRTAVLLHELVHAARSRLGSICFEEIVAFEAMKTLDISFIYTVRSWLSRVCVATTDSISILFWQVLLFCLVAIGSLSVMGYVGMSLLFWGCLILRGWWLISIWKRAFNTIERAFSGKGWPFLLRASDPDIVFVAGLSQEKVYDEIMERAKRDWRWEYLVSCAL